MQTSGRQIITNLLSALGGTVPKYHAMGTGAGPADNTVTALTTEVENRATGVVTRVTTTTTNDTFQSVGTQTATASRAITEVGLFDQIAVGGNALILSTISVINLANADSLTTTFKISFS